MTWIVEAAALSGAAERLTGTRSGPDADVVGNSGESKRVGPNTDAREKMSLPRPGNIIWGELGDRTAIDATGRDGSSLDKLFEPRRREGFDLVVERKTH